MNAPARRYFTVAREVGVMTTTTTELTSATERASAPPSTLDALAGLPLALNATLELRAVLRLLIEASLAVSHADRCSIFLLRDRRSLEPTVAVGRRPDDDLWEKFRALPPIEIPANVAVRRDLLDGRAVAIEDATQSDVIPALLTEAFSLQSVVLVPLLAARELCGVLAVDYQRRRVSQPSELTGLELIGSYAGLAVRNAQLYGEQLHRARLNECLAEGVAELVSSHDVEHVYRTLTGSYRKMLEADSCGVAILDDAADCITILDSAGRTRPMPMADIPTETRDDLRAQWRLAAEPRIFVREPWVTRLTPPRRAKLTTHLLVPLVFDDDVRAVVYVGFKQTRQLAADEDIAIRGLAAAASAALERARLIARLREHVARLDTLYRLGDVIGQSSQPQALRRRLNTLLQSSGVRVEAIEVTDRRIARRLSWPEDVAPTPSNGRRQASVPLRVGHRTIGALRVSTTSGTDTDTDPFLNAVATGVGEALVKGAARVTLQESARDRALAAERERIALDLHDTVGQAFVTTMLLARRAAEELPPDSIWTERFERIAAIGSQGKWSLDQSIRALTFVPDTRTGLPAALRAFARSIADDSDLRVPFTVRGRVRRLPVAVERALYRVGHQALSNAWRHSRASAVSVALDYGEHEVSLTIRDNGIGLSLRPDSALSGVGFTSMRRALAAVQGHLSVSNAEPTGLVVCASVPR
jgi:signal transduction histidine kinase